MSLDVTNARLGCFDQGDKGKCMLYVECTQMTLTDEQLHFCILQQIQTIKNKNKHGCTSLTMQYFFG